ncbi:MAG: DUF4418 family protein [Clostridiales bacterium]|nr:DUF4418 family protein [Clostridiales bacterium]
MKKRNIVFGLIIGLMCIVLALGVQTFAKPCVHDRKLMTLLTVEGGAVAVLAGIGMIRPGLKSPFLAAIGGILAILTPGTLMKICADEMMRCQVYTRPTAVVTGALIVALSLVWFGLELKHREHT